LQVRALPGASQVLEPIGRRFIELTAQQFLPSTALILEICLQVIFEPIKPTSPPEPLFTFRYPELGYSIQIVPHTSADSAKIKRAARAQHVSLRDYCQEEIIASMVLAEFDWE